MSARVKICGVNSPAAWEAAAAADYAGLVFFPRSPRFLTPERAAAMVRPGGPRKVGLFVAPEGEEIARALEAVSLDILQLYAGAETCRAMRARFGLPVWRAVPVAARSDLPMDDEGLDGFVIEAKPPADATRPGGNAAQLDWPILKGWESPLPWLLAGGLTPENVGAALKASGAPGVDVSSGVEEAPGVKSPALIRAFIASARRP